MAFRAVPFDDLKGFLDARLYSWHANLVTTDIDQNETRRRIGLKKCQREDFNQFAEARTDSRQKLRQIEDEGYFECFDLDSYEEDVELYGDFESDKSARVEIALISND